MAGVVVRLFTDLVPEMQIFRQDLLTVEIEPVDAAGRRVDFHALRMSFQMILMLNGTAHRVAMELMRHRDIKLTMKTYTDAGLLPIASAIERLPSLNKSSSQVSAENSPPDSPAFGAKGHLMAQRRKMTITPKT